MISISQTKGKEKKKLLEKRYVALPGFQEEAKILAFSI
jgi:hypothetical protein